MILIDSGTDLGSKVGLSPQCATQRPFVTGFATTWPSPSPWACTSPHADYLNLRPCTSIQNKWLPLFAASSAAGRCGARVAAKATNRATPLRRQTMPFSLLFDSKGCTLENQHFTWRDLVQKPISKLDDDAFTRVRIILMNGLENEALLFGPLAARKNGALRLPLAQVRRCEQHQASM